MSELKWGKDRNSTLRKETEIFARCYSLRTLQWKPWKSGERLSDYLVMVIATTMD